MLAISTEIGIDIDSQQVLHHIGYTTSSEPPTRMVSLVEEYLEYTNYIIDATYSYVIREILLVQGNHVFMEDSVTFESKVIAQLLKQCQKCLQ